MQLLSLETEEERSNFDKIYVEHLSSSDHPFYYIGAIVEIIGNYSTWQWVATKEPITIQLQFNTGKPNNRNGADHCMALQRKNKESFVFNDCPCSGNILVPFLCSRKVKKID